MEILNRFLWVIQYAAIGAGCITLFQFILGLYLRWQLARWMLAEFPDLRAGDVLTEQEQLHWNVCYEEKRQWRIYLFCELAFIILAMPAIAIYSKSKSESYDIPYLVFAMIWFVGFLIVFGMYELG